MERVIGDLPVTSKRSNAKRVNARLSVAPAEVKSGEVNVRAYEALGM
jgi:hypothetical protein